LVQLVEEEEVQHQRVPVRPPPQQQEVMGVLEHREVSMALFSISAILVVVVGRLVEQQLAVPQEMVLQLAAVEVQHHLRRPVRFMLVVVEEVQESRRVPLL
jgi:hypothetical protein